MTSKLDGVANPVTCSGLNILNIEKQILTVFVSLQKRLQPRVGMLMPKESFLNTQPLEKTS